MRIPNQTSRFNSYAKILTGLCLLAMGCASNPQGQQPLQAGEQAFTAEHYDQAIQYADMAIATPSSQVLPEAHYLRGISTETRQRTDQAEYQHNLQAAAVDYAAALSEHPTKQLEALVRLQMGYCVYRQERYPESLQQFTMADALLADRADLKMWNDYYMGICQQRLGRFTDADGSFQRVEADFPGTEPAKRAHLREGLRGFYVQVGAFADADDAAKAAGAVSAAGGVAMKTSSKNLTVIRSGNVPSYAQAVVLRSRLAGQYPDASVVP